MRDEENASWDKGHMHMGMLGEGAGTVWGRGLQASLEVKDSHVTLTPVNPDGQQQSLSVSSQFVTSLLNPTLDLGMESIFKTTSQFDVSTPTSVAPLPITAPTMTSSTIATITTTSQAPILPTTVLSNIIQNLPSFGSLFRFDERLRSLEANFSEAMQTNQFAGAYEHLRDEAQRENDEFLRTVDENMKKIIKEQDEEPSAGPDWGSKRRREGKEPESASAPMKTTTRSTGRSTQGSRSRQASASESALAEEPMQTTSQMGEPSHLEFDTDRDWNKTLPAVHESIQPWISELAKQTNSYSSFNELMDTALDFSNFLINRIKPLPLIPNNRGRRVIPFEHFVNNDLEYLHGGASSRKYTTSITKTKAADYWHIKWIEDLVPRTMRIKEPIGYDKHALWGRRIIAITELKIVEWHNYKHLDWITVRQDDDKLYKFKEGDFKRLRIQDIEDMLLLLVQGKLTNLTVEDSFSFNVSLRMFTRSIVIQRHVEDLQLGVESYQKKLNLTNPDSYRSDLKRKEAYTAYSNPRGFIYQNKDKRNRLMRIDELHKFSDGMLIDVRTALDDRLKGIQMQYLP
uniref:Uncharacterized protein n=1 Tax=Tanacetum cinerariifolium TaxID=118510 RepID=A0A6L2LMY8_TANCI|nr:hypothetical protein [Tanacetum cinerariifolium]